MASAPENQNFFSRHPWAVATFMLLAAGALLASFKNHAEIIPVRAVEAQRGTIRSVVSTNGKVEPLQTFEAHAPIGATVRRLAVREGDHVRKGQLLLQLNDAEARSQAAKAMAQVRESQAGVSAIESGGNGEEVFTVEAQLVKARAERDAARRNLEALQRLQQKAAASAGEVRAAADQSAASETNLNLLQQKQTSRYSKPEIAHVDAQRSAAETAYEAAEVVVDQMNVRAPFDGVVYALPVRAGVYVNPGDLLVQVADLSKVQVRAFVDEPDVARLVPGQKIEVTWDAIPGRIWDSTVSNIPAAVKLRGSRNVGETICVVNNADFRLLPNVNVDVNVITMEHRDALTIPREALRLDDGKPYVFEVVNNRLKRQDVNPSLADLTRVEVTGELPDRAQVVLASTNSKSLVTGATAKVIP